MKDQLIALFEQTYKHQIAFSQGLTEAEKERLGEPVNWSARDNLAHIAVYSTRLVANLRVALHGGEFFRIDDIDQANAGFFQAHQQDSWETVLADLAQAHAGLVGLLAELSETDLLRVDFFPWQNRPLWRTLAGTNGIHPISHISNYLAQNGRSGAAIALYRAVQPYLSAVHPEPTWQALVIYDQACVYAVAGEISPALECLQQSFAQDPSLKDWAKQDSDLVNLRQEAGFLDLVK